METDHQRRLTRIHTEPAGKIWWNLATVMAVVLLVALISLLAVDGGRFRTLGEYLDGPTEASETP